MLARSLRSQSSLLASSSSRRAASSAPTSSPSSVAKPPALRTQLLVHRRPYLTPPQPAFLEATHAYTARLSRALAAPLSQNIYFKKGSLAARRFAHEEAVADRAAFGIEPETDVEVVERDSAVLDVLDRADRAEPEGREQLKGTLESAERKGERSVYLCVQGEGGKWRFPGEDVAVPAVPEQTEDARGLAARAQAATHALLGPNLSLWPVGRHPIAFLPSPPAASSPEALTFVFKSHVLAGFPVLSALAVEHGWTAFGFLTKEELGERVLEEGTEEGRAWWAVVEGLLNEY